MDEHPAQSGQQPHQHQSTVETVGENPLFAAVPAVNAPQKAAHRSRFMTVVAGVVILNLLLAAGNVVLLKKANHPALNKAVANTTDVTPEVTASANQTPVTTATTTPGQVNTKTLHYNAAALGVEFDYPVDWRIASVDANQVVISSGEIDYQLSDGTAVHGRIILNVQTPDQYDSYLLNDEYVAISSSKLVNYSNPAPGQRKQTNLTFLADPYQADKTADRFLLLYVSGNVAYKKGELLKSHDHSKVKPIIMMYVDTCGDFCQAWSPGDITTNSLETDPNLQKVQRIIESLRIT